jgi:hypothetical protein
LNQEFRNPDIQISEKNFKKLREKQILCDEKPQDLKKPAEKLILIDGIKVEISDRHWAIKANLLVNQLNGHLESADKETLLQKLSSQIDSSITISKHDI